MPNTPTPENPIPDINLCKPQIPVPAWSDGLPDLLKVVLDGSVTGLRKAYQAGDSAEFTTTTNATVTVTGLVTGSEIEVTKSAESGYDLQKFTMPNEGVEIKVVEPEE